MKGVLYNNLFALLNSYNVILFDDHWPFFSDSQTKFISLTKQCVDYIQIKVYQC